MLRMSKEQFTKTAQVCHLEIFSTRTHVHTHTHTPPSPPTHPPNTHPRTQALLYGKAKRARFSDPDALSEYEREAKELEELRVSRETVGCSCQGTTGCSTKRCVCVCDALFWSWFTSAVLECTLTYRPASLCRVGATKASTNNMAWAHSCLLYTSPSPRD